MHNFVSRVVLAVCSAAIVMPAQSVANAANAASRPAKAEQLKTTVSDKTSNAFSFP